MRPFTRMGGRSHGCPRRTFRAIEPIDASRNIRSLEEVDDPARRIEERRMVSMLEACPSRLLPLSASSATLPAVRLIEEIRASGRRGPMSRRIQG